MAANTKVLLEPGNEIAAFCRAEQGRQRRLAEACGMTDCKLSLTLRGKRWSSAAEMASIEAALASMRRSAAKASRKGKVR